MLLGALAVAAPPLTAAVKEIIRPSASVAQMAAFQVSLDGISKRLDDRDAAIAAGGKSDAKRWTISTAFQCSQGFRARGLDCAAAQAYADIQPVPLQPKGAPQWKATAQWPIIPTPNE